MRPEERDLSLIWDMLEAAKDVVSFTQDVKFIDFEMDKKLRYAVERQILVIGEAAKHISEVTKSAYPDIPWSNIIGMRNVLAHEYGEILTSRIWSTSKKDVPELMSKIQKVLTALDSELNI